MPVNSHVSSDETRWDYDRDSFINSRVNFGLLPALSCGRRKKSLGTGGGGDGEVGAARDANDFLVDERSFHSHRAGNRLRVSLTQLARLVAAERKQLPRV